MKRIRVLSLIFALILSMQAVSAFAKEPEEQKMEPDVPYTVNAGEEVKFLLQPEENGDYVIGCIDATEGVEPAATVFCEEENILYKTEFGRKIVHLTRGRVYTVTAYAGKPAGGGSFTLMIKMAVKADRIYLLPTETDVTVGEKTTVAALFDPWYGAPERIIFEADNECAKVYRTDFYNVADVLFAAAGEVTVRAYCDGGLSTSVTFGVSAAPVLVKCGEVELGKFTPGDEITLPVPGTLVKDGAVRRFFTWSGAKVKRSAYDPNSGTPNGRTYTLTVPDGDVELTPVYVWVGDISGDELVTVADVAEMKNLLSSALCDERGYEASDINSDGLSTIHDLAVFKAMLAGNYTPER